MPITDPNAALAEGDQLLDNNRTEDAIEAYKQAVTLNPDFAEATLRWALPMH
ncbi:MAG: tetratricopeptide repeat protein [Chloracidobacterium sp.]|nr:tetratricopeptide repeat protein [Chloracidobacterium sp.]